MEVSEAEVVASITRDSFYEFFLEFVDVVIPGKVDLNWHIKFLCEELQQIAEAVFRGEGKRYDLICNISPGTTKSTIFSVLFPAWVWTRMPHAQFICVSYSDKLAFELSRKCREVIKSDKYAACFPEIQMMEDSDTKGHFTNTRTGKRYAAGAGGSVQGFHGDFIIIDDPLDPTQALSTFEMDRTDYWIKQTLSGRKTNKARTVTIMVMQRLHQDDPSATMARRVRVRWLRIPHTTQYTINPPELVNFYRDGLFDPERLSREVIAELEGPEGVGEFVVAAQYGQDPVPAGGGKFKTERVMWGTPPGKYSRTIRSWDKAATQEKNPLMSRGPAFTVGTLMGIDLYKRIWVLDVIRERLDSHTREMRIRQVARADGPGVMIALEQEPGSAGKDGSLATVKRLLGFRVYPVAASGSKELRAEEFSVAFNGGVVWLPEKLKVGNTPVGWAKPWIEEAKHWPHSTYLDQIDSAALGYNLLVQAKGRVGRLRSREQRLAEMQAMQEGNDVF